MPAGLTRVAADGVVPPETGSELALSTSELAAGATAAVTTPDRDSLILVVGGSGTLELEGVAHLLEPRAAALVVAGENADLVAGSAGLEIVQAAVAPFVDRHAPLGEREVVVSVEDAAVRSATGKRSFQVLFGPHNGSTRATMFVGYIPAGRAPWHYHLYDEIVWVPEGPGRLHLEGEACELGAGAAFRLHSREVHIVENAGETDMAILGVFTPAGSPTAAYLPAGSGEGPELSG